MPEDLAGLIAAGRIGGVVLFARNIGDPEQVRNLNVALHACAPEGAPLLIAIDQEGGRIQRLREPWTEWPPMRRLGERDSIDDTRAVARALGRELADLRVDLNFAPVVDVDTNPDNPVIGDRSFSRNAEDVGRHAAAFVEAIQDQGVAACAKHFPGHGAVVADSHTHLPIDRREFGDVLDDMQPYEALIRHRYIGAVMMAHIVYSETDSLPAGFSSYWIGNQLRSQLGFDGAVFCDDLSMAAAAAYGSVPKRAKLALEAGCDMVLVCNNRSAASATVASLRDYSHPTSLVRLARLHGTGHLLRESLIASEEWQQAAERLGSWSDRPVLELDA